MAEVEIYTTPLCPYCWRAKRLLDKKGVAFIEIDLWQQPQRRAEMIERAAGRTTVPQLFVDGARSAARTSWLRSSATASSTPCWGPAERPGRLILRVSL